MKIKKSFISNIIGRNTYDEFKILSRLIVVFGTIIIIILYGLSSVYYSTIVSTLLNLTTGTSLIFFIYVLAFIILLDTEVLIDIPEEIDIDEYPYGRNLSKTYGSLNYKLTIVWGIILITVGILAIYSTNRHRKDYAFKCNTFWVDKECGIYHLDVDNDCEIITKSNNIERMYGYEIKNRYTFCEWCKEWQEDVETYAY